MEKYGPFYPTLIYLCSEPAELLWHLLTKSWRVFLGTILPKKFESFFRSYYL